MDHLKQIVKFGLVCGTLFIILLISCLPNKSEIPIIEVSTSGCYKSCPILDLKFEKGTIYLNLIKNNIKEGLYKYKLNDTETSEFELLFSSINFDNLAKEYISNRNDMQVYNSRIISKGFDKTIYFYEGDVPKEYKNMIFFLIDLRKKQIERFDKIFISSTRKRVQVIDVSIPPAPKDTIQ